MLDICTSLVCNNTRFAIYRTREHMMNLARGFRGATIRTAAGYISSRSLGEEKQKKNKPLRNQKRKQFKFTVNRKRGADNQSSIYFTTRSKLLEIKCWTPAREGFISQSHRVHRCPGWRGAASVDGPEMTASVSGEQRGEFNAINLWLEALQPQLQCQAGDEVVLSDQALSSAD